MPSAEHFDITIAGGGHVGASLACLLATSYPAWRIALIEAGSLSGATEADAIRPLDARSTALSRGSVEILQALQLWPQLLPYATAIRQVHVSDRGRFPGSEITRQDEAPVAVGYVIENIWLTRVLADVVKSHPNIHCIEHARVSSAVPTSAGMTLNVTRENQSQTIETSLVVVADGNASPLRAAAGIGVDRHDYRQTAIITNVSFSHRHHGVAYERFTAEGPMALLPLAGDTGQSAALVWTLPTERAAQLCDADTSVFLSSLQQRFGSRLGRFTDVGQRFSFPLARVTAKEQIRRGMVLVGNAAHSLHPVAGQGFNLALRDCAVLTEVLANAARASQSPGELSVLRRYAERQWQDQLITIHASDRLVRWFSTDNPFYVTLRHLGFLGLASLPPLRREFAAHAMGVAGAAPRWQPSAEEGES